MIEGYQNGSLVKVSHTLATLSITCVAREGKPAAQLKWLRNGVEITEGPTETNKVGFQGGTTVHIFNRDLSNISPKSPKEYPFISASFIKSPTIT